MCVLKDVCTQPLFDYHFYLRLKNGKNKNYNCIYYVASLFLTLAQMLIYETMEFQKNYEKQ